MQPARDPNDVRYWPRREGGQGFRNPNDTRPSRQYSALRTYDPHGNLVTDETVTPPTVTSIVAAQDYTPDTVRSRARAALVLAIKRATDTLSDDANELRLNELAPTLAALGRISGVQVEEQKSGDIRIHIVRDALPEPASPRALPAVDDAQVIDVSDDVATAYDDEATR